MATPSRETLSTLTVQEMDELKEICREVALVPTITRARIFEKDENIFLVKSTWSHKSYELPKKLSSDVLFTIKTRDDSINFDVLNSTSSSLCADSDSIAYSSSGSKLALLCTSEGREKNKKQQSLQIYDQDRHIFLCFVNASASEKYGTIHSDDVFGGLKWSNGEGHVLFTAELKKKKSEFFDSKIDWTDVEGVISANVGDKYVKLDSWGEQISEIKCPVLCILHISTGNVEILDAIPKEISPAYSIWAPKDEGIVFFGLDNEPFKIGRVYCNNRRGKLYYYKLGSAHVDILIDDETSAESLRFSPDGTKLVFFERKPGGPHNNEVFLRIMNWNDRTTRSLTTKNDFYKGLDGFYGFYDVKMPVRCWSSDLKHIFISSVNRSACEIYSINIDNQRIKRLSNKGVMHGSWDLLDVHNDKILAVCSAPNRPYLLLLGNLSVDREDIIWIKLNDPLLPHPKNVINHEYSVHVFERNLTLTHDKEKVPYHYECILLKPIKKHKIPLIVCPHGGPHGVSLIAWPKLFSLFLVNCGFAVLLVNYHGSIGFGANFVESLPGNCGNLDVEDVVHAVREVLMKDEQLNSSQIGLWGASHGGFIVSHIVGQYPKMFKACVALNPVHDFYSMFNLSDIPDWGVYEATGIELEEWKKYPPFNSLKNMYSNSPIARVEEIVTPYLLLIGEKDLRVASHYGSFIRSLQARNVPVRILTYAESNHAISELSCEADWLLNSVLWFLAHM